MFQDYGGGIGMMRMMLMKKGYMAWEETDTIMVQLIAILFEVTLAGAELTDVDEGTGLDSMSLFFVPGTLVVEFLVGPVLWTIYSFFDMDLLQAK